MSAIPLKASAALKPDFCRHCWRWSLSSAVVPVLCAAAGLCRLLPPGPAQPAGGCDHGSSAPRPQQTSFQPGHAFGVAVLQSFTSPAPGPPLSKSGLLVDSLIPSVNKELPRSCGWQARLQTPLSLPEISQVSSCWKSRGSGCKAVGAWGIAALGTDPGRAHLSSFAA